MFFDCAPRSAGGGTVVKGRRGKSLRIDIHCHYFNPEVAKAVEHLGPALHEVSGKWMNEITREVNKKQVAERSARLSSIEVRLKDMDRMGIDVQAVSPAPNQCYYWTDPGLGAELARKVNERIAEIVAKWPDRFVGLGSVPLQDASLAVSELEYCVKTLGLRGVEINPNVNGAELTDPRLALERFFRKAEELGIIIFMHPLGYTQGERLTNHYFNNVIGNPLDTTVAVSHLIFDGVMQRYPGLKVVLPHAGGYIAHYWARMDHAWKARADCRTVIKRKPSSYLEKFYFDTITFDRGMLRQMVERFGADHVLLGTDYPYDMGVDDPLGFTDFLPAAQRRAVQGGNAARLLKMDYTKSTRRKSR